MIEAVKNAFLFVVMVYPIIKAAIETAEASKANGTDKKTAVIDLVKVILEGVNRDFLGNAIPVSMVMGLAGYIIDGIVAMNNALGVFKHKETPGV
jgi:hypothetical protein